MDTSEAPEQAPEQEPDRISAGVWARLLADLASADAAPVRALGAAAEGAAKATRELREGLEVQAATAPLDPDKSLPLHLRRQRARAARATRGRTRRQSAFATRWAIIRAGRIMDGKPVSGAVRHALRARLLGRGGAKRVELVQPKQNSRRRRRGEIAQMRQILKLRMRHEAALHSPAGLPPGTP